MTAHWGGLPVRLYVIVFEYLLLSKGRRSGHVTWRASDAIITLHHGRLSSSLDQAVTLSRACRVVCLDPNPRCTSHFRPPPRGRSLPWTASSYVSNLITDRRRISMRWRRSDLAPLRRLQTQPPSLSLLPVSSQVQPSSSSFTQSVSSRTFASCTLELAGTHIAPEKWNLKWNAALTPARIRESPESPCSSTVWSRAFRFLMLLEMMGSTPFNALICESESPDNFGSMYIANYRCFFPKTATR